MPKQPRWEAHSAPGTDDSAHCRRRDSKPMKLRNAPFALLTLLAALALTACNRYPTPEDIEDLYVKEGQGLGHRFIGEAAANYYVGIGDGIVLAVAGAPEISGPYVVGIDGKITLPFVEDVYVGGLTRKEIANKVENVLKRFYRDPKVSVTMAAYNSKKFYVFGEALRVGALPYTGDITMIDVLANVGINPITAKKNIFLIRSDPVKPRVYISNYHHMTYYGISKTNFQVREDDIIYVRANIWGKLAKLIARITYPIQVLSSALLTGARVYALPLQVDIQREYLSNGRRY